MRGDPLEARGREKKRADAAAASRCCHVLPPTQDPGVLSQGLEGRDYLEKDCSLLLCSLPLVAKKTKGILCFPKFLDKLCANLEPSMSVGFKQNNTGV